MTGVTNEFHSLSLCISQSGGKKKKKGTGCYWKITRKENVTHNVKQHVYFFFWPLLTPGTACRADMAIIKGADFLFIHMISM